MTGKRSDGASRHAGTARARAQDAFDSSGALADREQRALLAETVATLSTEASLPTGTADLRQSARIGTGARPGRAQSDTVRILRVIAAEPQLMLEAAEHLPSFNRPALVVWEAKIALCRPSTDGV